MRALFVATLMLVLAVPVFAQSGRQTIYDMDTGEFRYFYQNRDGSGYIYDPSNPGHYQYVLPSRRPDRDDQRDQRDRNLEDVCDQLGDAVEALLGCGVEDTERAELRQAVLLVGW